MKQVAASDESFLRCGKNGLVPESKDGGHDQVTDQLVAGVDGKKLHGLLHEEYPGELHGGDKAKPDVSADEQAILEVLRAHLMQKQSKDESRHQAREEGDQIG